MSAITMTDSAWQSIVKILSRRFASLGSSVLSEFNKHPDKTIKEILNESSTQDLLDKFIDKSSTSVKDVLFDLNNNINAKISNDNLDSYSVLLPLTDSINDAFDLWREEIQHLLPQHGINTSIYISGQHLSMRIKESLLILTEHLSDMVELHESRQSSISVNREFCSSNFFNKGSSFILKQIDRCKKYYKSRNKS